MFGALHEPSQQTERPLSTIKLFGKQWACVFSGTLLFLLSARKTCCLSKSCDFIGTTCDMALGRFQFKAFDFRTFNSKLRLLVQSFQFRTSPAPATPVSRCSPNRSWRFQLFEHLKRCYTGVSFFNRAEGVRCLEPPEFVQLVALWEVSDASW